MALTIDSLRELYEKLGGEDFGNVTTIPEALDKLTEVATGGGDTYETVAEIAVGTTHKMGELYVYGIPDGTKPHISDEDFLSGKLYVNGINLIQDSEVLGYNIDPQTMTVIAEPAIGFTIDGGAGEYNIVAVAAYPDISNTTVKILKKVSGSETITVDSELSETSKNPVQNKVITAALEAAKPLIVHGTIDMVNSTAEITDDITIADIVAAYVADRAVFFQATLGEGYYVRLGLFQCIGNELTFSVSDIGSNAVSVYTCEFDNSKTGTFNHAP